jgi:hypothetical protein
MKIICIEDGIDITYNGGETYTESVFGLDEDKNILQNFTFNTHLHIDKNNFKTITDNSDIVRLHNGFLLYSFGYEVSFAHYMTQTIPMLIDYLDKYKDYKLLIPKHRYHNLCKDILESLKITETQIEVLTDKTIYNIDNFIKVPFYDAPPSPFSETHIKIYNKIRDSLEIKQYPYPERKVYLKRDGIQNNDFGNSETGKLRQIYNEDILIDKLKENGFEIIVLGNKHIQEKKLLLENIKILVTPIGANCVNLIFGSSPRNIVYLSNNKNFGFEYYTSLCENLNNTKINSVKLLYKGIPTDPKNQWNDSFSVDIEQILSVINKFN